MTYPRIRLKYLVDINPDVLDESTDPNATFSYTEISDVTHGSPIQWKAAQPFSELPSRARRIVKTGDVVVSTVRTYLKAITRIDEHVPDNALVSTGFAVLRPRDINSKFLSYALQNEEFVSEVVARSVGVSYPAISPAELINISIPVPPLSIQERIVHELDRELAEIDEFIADLEKIREVLNEKYELDLDDLYWKNVTELVPLKRFIKYVDQGSSPNADSNPALENEVGILKAGCTADGKFNILANKKIIPGTQIKESTFVRNGDLLVTRASGSKKIVGSASIVENLDRQLALSDKIYRFHTANPEVSKYICEIMATRRFRHLLELEITGAEGLARNISLNSLTSIKIPNIGKDNIKKINDIATNTNLTKNKIINLNSILSNLLSEKGKSFIIDKLI